MLIQKVKPIGVDFVIANIQTKIYDYLVNRKGFTKYESYERAYLNEDKAEIYIGKNEYKDCLFNDKFNVTSFFLADEKREFDYEKTRGFNHEISIVFQCNLSKLYPTILHRADEEFNKDCFNALYSAYGGLVINEVVTGLKNVYEGLGTDLLTNSDISNFHILKINFNINYKFCK